MNKLIKEILTSKKVLATVSGVVVALALRLGFEVSVETVATVISPIVAYILGQGWADTGKEAAKITGIDGIREMKYSSGNYGN